MKLASRQETSFDLVAFRPLMSLRHRDPYHYIEDFSSSNAHQLVRFPIDGLREIYEEDARWSQYFSELSADFKAFRTCDSDSNSLLRAFGYAFVEMLARNPESLFEPFLEEMRAGEGVFQVRDEFEQAAQIFSQTLEHLWDLAAEDKDMSMFNTQTLLGRRWFDRVLREFLRMVLLNYTELNAKDTEDCWGILDISPAECAALLRQDAVELDEKMFFLLSRALDVTVRVMDLAGKFEDNVAYQSSREGAVLALFKDEITFGVLYSEEDLAKDKFDVETRRYDVGEKWSKQEDD